MGALEGVRQIGTAYVVSVTPDVCLTPMGATAVPVPYPIIAKFDDAVLLAMSVRMCGRPTFTTSSQVSRVQGDEAGTGGGVKSGVNRSICESVTASTTVRAEGNFVLRDGDVLKMNNGNTLGRVVYKAGVGTEILGAPSPPVLKEFWGPFLAGAWDTIKNRVEDSLDWHNLIPGYGIYKLAKALRHPGKFFGGIYDHYKKLYHEGGVAEVSGSFAPDAVLAFLTEGESLTSLADDAAVDAENTAENIAQHAANDAEQTAENTAKDAAKDAEQTAAPPDEDAAKTTRWQRPVDLSAAADGLGVTGAPPRIVLLDISDPAIERAMNVKPVPGLRDIDIHANSQGFGVKINDVWHKLSPREVADRVRKFGPPPPGGYRLIGCEAGFEAGGPAQQLANELGAPVWAPDKIVGNFEDGTLYSGTKAANSGRFRQFDPGGESPFIDSPDSESP
jgi:hypothetical protein